MLAPASGDTDVVRAFYDAHPYPPPVPSLDPDRELGADERRRLADHHLMWPASRVREHEEILVAGCGTSQGARYAARHPHARVTAIDVSSVSLDHERRLRDQYELSNLELHELPIEHVGELGRGFDRVVCTGVLHHLADPDAGLSALRDVMKPDAAAHLMVYAPYGRAGVHMLQEYGRRLDVGTSAAQIRDLAAMLDVLPQNHPLTFLLRTSPDFQNPDALADALLNPRERAYTVPELLAYLERCGLRFGRWYRQAPYLPQCGAIARSPHARALARLPGPEGYAAVELLRGTMVRHSLIAYRDDLAPAPYAQPLERADWPAAVPLRLPHTLCLEERLPPDAAAVLLNQAHQYSDLALPIGSAQKRMFDAIDGRRTITEVALESDADLGSTRTRDRVRAFLERLWSYDQVVFDLTRARATPTTRT